MDITEENARDFQKQIAKPKPYCKSTSNFGPKFGVMNNHQVTKDLFERHPNYNNSNLNNPNYNQNQQKYEMDHAGNYSQNNYDQQYMHNYPMYQPNNNYQNTNEHSHYYMNENQGKNNYNDYNYNNYDYNYDTSPEYDYDYYENFSTETPPEYSQDFYELNPNNNKMPLTRAKNKPSIKYSCNLKYILNSFLTHFASNA